MFSTPNLAEGSSRVVKTKLLEIKGYLYQSDIKSVNLYVIAPSRQTYRDTSWLESDFVVVDP